MFCFVLLFWQNQKNPIFGGVFGHYSQNEIFPQISGSVSFLPLRHPDFMRSFRKKSPIKSHQPFWRKHVYLLTY